MRPPTTAELDRDHVWHPYAAMPGTGLLPVVESASGVRLRLAQPVDGVDELIDGMSSWWSAVHGYGHPVLDRAVTDQVGRMSHVMFGGLTHEPAVRLARTLVEITPDPLQHVFFSDSGSVAVEVATKMCLQYQRGIGAHGKRRLLTWRGGYYGDTLRPMMLCDPEGMHHLWSGDQAGPIFADAPPPGFDAPVDADYVRHLTDLFDVHAAEVAGVIVEPVAQGAGGMVFHNPGYLRVLRDLCDRHGALLILDEIATGFGRTGALFAAEHAGVDPDVLCVGKALTGGYLSMAATLSTPEVAAGIAGGDVPVLAHGPTFMANPLAAAVADAAVGLLLEGDWRADVCRIEGALRRGLEGVAAVPGVADVRVLGAIGVVQLDHPVDVAAATAAAIRNGVWLRPFRDLIYTMPPYITSDADLASITDAVGAAARVG